MEAARADVAPLLIHRLGVNRGDVSGGPLNEKQRCSDLPFHILRHDSLKIAADQGVSDAVIGIVAQHGSMDRVVRDQCDGGTIRPLEFDEVDPPLDGTQGVFSQVDLAIHVAGSAVNVCPGFSIANTKRGRLQFPACL